MASRGLNKVMLIGNLGADPDIRYSASGSAIANVSIATTDSWRDKNTGEQQDRTEWHRVVFFGKLAEIVQQYLKKGATIYVEGRLQTRKWQGKDGQDRYTTEVVAAEMTMLGGRTSNAGGDYAGAPIGGGQAPAPQAQQAPAAAAEPFDDNDIPF